MKKLMECKKIVVILTHYSLSEHFLLLFPHWNRIHARGSTESRTKSRALSSCCLIQFNRNESKYSNAYRFGPYCLIVFELKSNVNVSRLKFLVVLLLSFVCLFVFISAWHFTQCLCIFLSRSLPLFLPSSLTLFLGSCYIFACFRVVCIVVLNWFSVNLNTEHVNMIACLLNLHYCCCYSFVLVLSCSL